MPQRRLFARLSHSPTAIGAQSLLATKPHRSASRLLQVAGMTVTTSAATAPPTTSDTDAH